MAAQGILRTTGDRQVIAREHRLLAAKIDQAQQLAHSKEDSAFIAAGDCNPSPGAVASGAYGVALRSMSVDGCSSCLRPGSQLRQAWGQPGVDGDRRDALSLPSET